MVIDLYSGISLQESKEKTSVSREWKKWYQADKGFPAAFCE
jgi:hypothetical protein